MECGQVADISRTAWVERQTLDPRAPKRLVKPIRHRDHRHGIPPVGVEPRDEAVEDGFGTAGSAGVDEVEDGRSATHGATRSCRRAPAGTCEEGRIELRERGVGADGRLRALRVALRVVSNRAAVKARFTQKKG